MPQFKAAEDYRNFEHAVRRELRYVRGTAQQDFLQAVLETGRTRRLRLTKDTYLEGLWRAQLGHAWREVEKDGKVHSVPCAHPKSRMKPIPDKVSDGRANPKGIVCLYIATKQETAILEVRPLIGSYVTVSKIEIVKDLEIVDFTSYDINFLNGWSLQSIDDVEKAVWSDINDAFSKPVERSDDSLEYIPTQILSELFKSNGIDGVGYKSSYGEAGFNIALFDLDAANVVDGIFVSRRRHLCQCLAIQRRPSDPPPRAVS
jgi:RES domain